MAFSRVSTRHHLPFPLRLFHISRVLTLNCLIAATCIVSSSSSSSPLQHSILGSSDAAEHIRLFESKAKAENERPVIGILSQPGNGISLQDCTKDKGDLCCSQDKGGKGDNGDKRVLCNQGATSDQGSDLGSDVRSYERRHGAAGDSYIAASYVKFVEAGGARAVPVIYNKPLSEITQLMTSLNGLLLPGGYANKSGLYLKRIKDLIQVAMDLNQAGNYFPVLAECLGFELLSMVISKKGRGILERFEATHPSTLKFVGDWAKQRNMFVWMQPELVERMEKENLSMENHKFGISPKALLGDPDLSSFFTILTTTSDENGKEYVSTVEAQEYPFTAIQWHPEKNAFEWGNEFYPHSTAAAQVTLSAAVFFVNEARKSKSSFPTHESLMDALIYNYNPVFSGRSGPNQYWQVYSFKCINGSGIICFKIATDSYLSHQHQKVPGSFAINST